MPLQIAPNQAGNQISFRDRNGLSHVIEADEDGLLFVRNFQGRSLVEGDLAEDLLADTGVGRLVREIEASEEAGDDGAEEGSEDVSEAQEEE